MRACLCTLCTMTLGLTSPTKSAKTCPIVRKCQAQGSDRRLSGRTRPSPRGPLPTRRALGLHLAHLRRRSCQEDVHWPSLAGPVLWEKSGRELGEGVGTREDGRQRSRRDREPGTALGCRHWSQMCRDADVQKQTGEQGAALRGQPRGHHHARTTKPAPWCSSGRTGDGFALFLSGGRPGDVSECFWMLPSAWSREHCRPGRISQNTPALLRNIS